MENIQIVFLGTANAIPTKLRSHNSILIKWKNHNLLFDAGEGAQRQLRFADISPSKITKILLTHWHADHSLGLSGLIYTLAMADYKGKLEIYGPKKTKEKIHALESAFGQFKIDYSVTELSSQTLDFGDFQIQAEEMSHGIPCLAYSFKIKDKVRIKKDKFRKLKLKDPKLIKQLVSGKDINYDGKTVKAKSISFIEKGKKITLVLDTLINQNIDKIAKDSDLLVCESTFSDKEKEK